MKKETAMWIANAYTNMIDMIDLSVIEVSNHEDDGQIALFKKRCGKVMAEIVFGVLDPVYSEHPDLKPQDW